MKRLMILLVAVAISVPALAQEQTPTPVAPPQITWPDAQTFSLFRQGDHMFRVDFGVQPVDLDTDSSKFEEYRDLPDGTVLPFFAVSSAAADAEWRYLITGEDVGQQDARYIFGAEFGQWAFDVMYDQIPHRFGNEARSINRLTSRGSYAVSDTLQAAHQAAIEAQRAISPASVNFAFLRNLVAPSIAAVEPIDIELERKRGLVQVNYSPEGGLWAMSSKLGGGAETTGTVVNSGVTLTYFQENRTGTRQSGTSFGFGNVVETAEPIDYTTRDLGVGAELPLGNASIRGSLHYNDFDNVILGHQFDNPFRVTDSTDPSAYTAPAAGSIGGPTRGLVALPPTNKALTGALGLLWKLPANSRFTADLAMGQWTQDDELFPFTTNTAVKVAETNVNATDPAALPVRRFDGEIQTTSASLRFNAQPLAGLSLSASYRLYDLDNQSPRIEFPLGYVRFDAVWEDIPRITVPYEYSTDRAEISASYDFGMFDLEAGYRHDTTDRTFREVEETTEDAIRLAGGFRALDWITVRASYEFGERDFDGEYHAEESEHSSFLEPGPPANLTLLRRFDLAKKDLSRTNAMVTLTPFGSMGITLAYLGSEDDFDDESDYGLLNVDNTAWTAEVDYAPADRWSIYGFYSNESYNTFQRGRQSGATLSTRTIDDWTADVEDDVDSFGFGGTYAILPTLDFKLFSRYQKVDGFNNLDSPPGGTPDIAFDIPEFDDTRLWNANAELEYRLSDIWRVAVGGWFEDYEVRDAQTTGIGNYMPGGFFLAPNDSDYRGNVAYIRASYRR